MTTTWRRILIAGAYAGGIAIVALLAISAYALRFGDDDGSDAEVAHITATATATATARPTTTATPRVTPTPTARPTPTPLPSPAPTPTPLPSPAPTPTPPDGDNDTVPDVSDNCPTTYNPDQANTYGDGRGDACEPTPTLPDGDNDTVSDVSDNCPNTYNPDQANTYGDGRGDACEPTPTPVPTPTPGGPELGTYSGITSQGKSVEFDVIEGTRAIGRIKFDVEGECPVPTGLDPQPVGCTCEVTIETTMAYPWPIANNAFSYAPGDFEFSAIFDSATTASGFLRIHTSRTPEGSAPCESGQVTWTASVR